ncbi:MAG: prepilin-type N-terminal cleavage/methylation domain-containing protein, partial [Rickettsiales bacterium]
GFTLVELSIVLVIIGLIIGGVLVGQDLIKAAEIRATVSQIESYNAAVNTFRGRFNGLPGDIRNVTSFFDAGSGNTWPDLIDGDGDRSLEACEDGTGPGNDSTNDTDGLCNGVDPHEYVDVATLAEHTGELLQFWHHLSAAELVPGYYNGCYFGGAGDSGSVADCGLLEAAFPRSKMDRNGIGVYATGGRNYYQIGVTGAAMAYEVEPSLTPEEAYNLDQKMDDGKPGTGAVVAKSAQAGGTAVNTAMAAADGDFTASATATACVAEDVTGVTAPQWTYALLNENITCSLRLRMN